VRDEAVVPKAFFHYR